MQLSAKATRITRAHFLLLGHPNGLTDKELAALLGVSRVSALRYRQQLEAKVVGVGYRGRCRYTIDPTPEDVSLAKQIIARAR